MRKADLLDELRSDIGVVSDRCSDDIDCLYQCVCEQLVERMPNYQSVSIYLTEESSFVCRHNHGYLILPDDVPFGEGFFSLAAVRGGVVREKSGMKTKVFVPFYRGHHLVGELVIVSELGSVIDEEDVTLFCELASLFETKMTELDEKNV